MKYIFLYLILSVIPIQINANVPCIHTKESFQCVKYLYNYDGDTITVEIPNVHPFLGHHASVRIKDIDTPEIKGNAPCEKEAARIAKRLVENQLKNAKRIDLEGIEKEKYGRILATVKYDTKKDLKDILIKNNLAYPYEGGKKETIDWCKKLNLPPQKQ